MKKALLALLFSYFASSHAQYSHPYFNALTFESGLPDPFVTTALQDKIGYIWIGTQNGLARYDGYNIETYNMEDENGDPLASYGISDLSEDGNGTIWVNLRLEGLYWYNRQKDAFVKIQYPGAQNNMLKSERVSEWLEDGRKGIYWLVHQRAGDKLEYLEVIDTAHHRVETYSSLATGSHFIPLGTNSTFSLRKDSTGRLWLTTDSLLSLFNLKTGAFRPYFILPGNAPNVVFNDIYTDPLNADVLWLTTYLKNSQRGTNPHLSLVISYNVKTGTYKKYFYDSLSASCLAAGCSVIITDTQKRLWFVTDKGISLFSRQTQAFTNYALPLAAVSSGGNGAILSAAAGTDGSLWVGGVFSGLFRINAASGNIQYIGPSDKNEGSFPYGTYISKLFFDKTGILWAAAQNKGLVFINQHASFFNNVAKLSAEAEKLTGDGFITGVYNDSSIFVTGRRGLFSWNPYKVSFKKISLGDTLAEKEMFGFIKGNDGLLWMRSWGFGLYSYDPRSGSVKNYRNNPKDSSSVADDFVEAVSEGKDGTIWIGTNRNGICSLNKHNGKFTRYPFVVNNNGGAPAVNALSDNSVQSLYVGDEGVVWVGTLRGGLNRMDIKTGKFTAFHSHKNGLEWVNKIFGDSHGRLWAGTYYSGLFLVDKKTGAYKRYTEKDGLLYNGINSINEDQDGNILVSTDRGLSILNAQTNAITNFNAKDGLLMGNLRAIIKRLNGQYYLMLENGFVSVDPGELIKNPIPPQVVIQSVGYHSSNNTINNDDTSLLVYGRQNITLKYNENRVTFIYAGLHFGNSPLNQYACQLESYDKDWVQQGKVRWVTYTGLPPGKYIFRVKAANSDGVWNETAASIAISIYPPWWQTWWAYTIYTCTAALALWAFVYYRSKKLLKDNKRLEQKVKLRTAEVLEQKEEIIAQRDNLGKTLEELQATQKQLVQSEKMASLGELTAGIAHEIQNPMNFVNNFSEVSIELAQELKEEIDKCAIPAEIKENIGYIVADLVQNQQKINFHGKRADSIVKGMLQHSRTNTGEKEPADINQLADEYLRLSYHGLRAKDKNFNAQLETSFDASLPKFNIVVQDVSRVLINLFTNAFYSVMQKKKAAQRDYQPVVSISTQKIGNFAEIRVRDNGIGIPQHVLDKIYNPFFTTKPTGEGTGLGLSLSYEIVTKGHGGTIQANTKEGEFAEFVIRLPL